MDLSSAWNFARGKLRRIVHGFIHETMHALPDASVGPKAVVWFVFFAHVLAGCLRAFLGALRSNTVLSGE